MGRFCAYLMLVLALLAGCSRSRYRMRADRDTFNLLREKVGHQPWAPPSDFSLHPPPTSRLYDPTPPDDPWLPQPAPQLYGYELPELPPRRVPTAPEAVPVPSSGVPPVTVDDTAATALKVQPASFQTVPVNVLQPPAGAGPEAAPSPRAQAAREAMQETRTSEVLLAPIAPEAWEAVPPSCLARMLEFATLQAEYRRSFGEDPSPDQLAPGKRLTLEDIIHLTLLNSREYQTQKELLYRVSLRLSLERYAYELKFSPFNNGTDVNWNHTRVGGTTVNGLNIGTNFQVDKVLATGGDLVARFANNVVLTFNGPQGFAADVGSDLFLNINQTIFQRDVRFESITQSERDVVYAARDFIRFRKDLFVQLASQYYALIRTYRQVQIDAQNYFTLVRAFHQSAAEYRAGLLPRFQLDQVEQNVLSGRRGLIATCNSLEVALDNLKLRMGLPTETHINIDLTELEQLTKRDELSVTGELIRRIRQRLIEERTAEPPNRLELLSSSVVLIERMLDTQRLQEELGQQAVQREGLTRRLDELQVDAARENAGIVRGELNEALQAQPPSLPRVFQRTMDMLDALLVLIDRQLTLAEQRGVDQGLVDELRERHGSIQGGGVELQSELERLIDEGRLDELQQLADRASQLQAEAEMVSQQLDVANGFPPVRLTPAEEMARTLQETDQLLQTSEELLRAIGLGLTPIEISMDDAMLTALNLRFDLMNQRGDVADVWRQIKYAGDDLKSVLNINASQRVSTRRDVNRPFDFTFDESETRVGASFDAPFNRRAERNAYRQSLINYQAALRQLMLLEDNIKFAVRNDLRGLFLDREQYQIDVASAALAYERIVSVLLELRLGIGRAAARDFLEAQNAYANALSNVARQHIDYIVDRTQLFLDLELLTVGEDGFWYELYDESYQPTPFYQIPYYGEPVYGELVPGLWYSKYLRRLEKVPPGTAAIHQDASVADPNTPAQPELPEPVRHE